MDFLAIDFETANEHGESACALGIADVRDGRIVEQASWLIRPPDEYFTIRKRNRDIHGIGRPAIKDKEQFGGLWPRILPYFENRVVVAHNASSTEVSILRKLFAHFSIDPPTFRYFCTLQLAKASWYDELDKYKLEHLAEFLGCSFSHHDPRDDAMVCARFVLRASEDAGAPTIDELAQGVGLKVPQFTMVKEESHHQAGASIYGMRLSLETDSAEVGQFRVEVGERDIDLAAGHAYGFDEREVERRCGDAGVFTRGKKLFMQSKVAITSKSGTQCCGTATGSGKEPYLVRVDAGLAAECNCQAWINSTERFCKHCVALALLWDSAGGPTPLNELSDDDMNEAVLAEVEKLPPKLCKEILLELAAEEPLIVSRLVLGDD